MPSMLHAGSGDAVRCLLGAVAGASLLVSLAGCSSFGAQKCDRSENGNLPVLYTEGTVNNGVYMSSGWQDELLYFPGGMRYKLEHKLGQTPRWWMFYLSFNQHGTREDGTLSQAAGNQVLMDEIDSQHMLLFNDSCVEYWLLVVAGAGDAPAPEEDAGGNDDGGSPSPADGSAD